MSIKEVKQALGSWGITLRADTPRELIDQIESNKFGHIAIIPGRINPKLYGDALLRTARYVGVYRSTFKQSDDTIQIKGSGMAFWLGDEDEKGDIFETAEVFSGSTFANTIRALLPNGGAVVEGTIYSVPGSGTYTGRHQWETPRKAITYVTDTYSSEGTIVEWRVNGDGTLDAGPIENLYNVTTPRAILVKKDTGRDMRLLGLQADMSMDYDVEDLTTRIVLLAQGEGDSISTGVANAAPLPFRDIHGNVLKQTRLVSESDTQVGNANARAQLQLNKWARPRQAIQIRTEEFDIKGDFEAGDYIYVFDPEAGFYDTDNEVFWRGQPINPLALRVTEIDWQLRADWTVGFRCNDGTWLDLSEYYKPEGGGSTLAVGDYRRTLSGNNYESLGFRPNLPPPGADTTIPDSPTFTGFSVGSYQPDGSIGITKAAIRAQWSEPLNVDGSTITDGSHYEIRYRVNGVIGYTTAWDTLEASYDWDSLGSWDQMFSAPVEADPQWQTAIVGWDAGSFTLMELTPNVTYEIQIRAVDTATPPNRSDWSSSSFITTSGDIFPPSTPATPTVAASLVSIQVLHTLGKSSGGTFNLEPDMSHFDVHVGGSPSFLADASNKVGELVATGSMVLGRIPAVGTFIIEQTDGVWIKVIAVDTTGNRSPASEGAQATAELIDDAHISNLTVSKVTAGTISAEWVLGSRITTSLEGQRIEIGQFGLQGFDSDGARTIDLNNGPDPSLTFYQGTGTDGFTYTIPPIKIGKLPGGQWGMEIRDLYDGVQVRVGQLVAGSTAAEDYGLAAVDPDTGKLVSLNALAFGMEGAEGFSGSLSVADTSGSYIASSTGDGPKIEHIRIGDSLRCKIEVSARLTYDYPLGGDRVAYMSWRLTQESTGTTIWAGTDTTALVWGTSGDVSDHCSTRAFLAEGLAFFPAPGLYTVEAMYRVLSFDVKGMIFSDRQLIVTPF